MSNSVTTEPAKVVVTARIEPEDAQRLRDEAQRQRRTISWLVSEAVRIGLPTVCDQPW